MALQMKAQRVQISRAPLGLARPRAVAVVCKAQKEEVAVADRVKSAAMASMVAGALLFGSGVVDPQAAEAARSGGRVSSSGFSSRRAAPAPA